MADEKLGDVADILMGQSPPGEFVTTVPGGLPLLNGPTEFGSHHPLPAQFTSDIRKKAQVGDLLFCVRGSTTGRMNWADQEYAIGRGIAAIRHKQDVALQPLLRAVIEMELPALLAQATGSTFPNVSRSQLEDITYPSLNTAEELAVARIFGTIDDSIHLCREMNRTIEKIAGTLFRSWFVDFEPVSNRQAECDSQLKKQLLDLFPSCFDDSELGPIPSGWAVGSIEQLCKSIENGGTPWRMENDYWGGDIPWFKTGELTDGPLIDSEEKITIEGLKSSACKIWPVGTILIALYASPTVGRLGILELPASSNQACSGLIPKPEYGSMFVFHSLLNSRDRLQQIAVGAAQQNISQQVVRQHRTLIPPVEVVTLFRNVIEPLYQRTVDNCLKSRTLNSLRSALIPKLLTGEFRLSDPNRIVGRSV